MSSPAPATTVRLLHLSDIHFRESRRWDADPLLRALTRFIATEVRGGLRPDLVVITGDLAFAGKAKEYKLAEQWLTDQLWPALSPTGQPPLPRDHLLLVPGNHDADRDLVDATARMVQDGMLAADQQRIAEVLSDPRQRRILLKRHDAWVAFHKRWTGLDQGLPWWQRTLQLNGQRLHLAGLDSAWMSHGDRDRGSLLLGHYQITETVLHSDGAGADWRLALLHHPWDYLAEQDGRATREPIYLNRDIVLRGHLHEPDAYGVRPPDPRRACLELAAGCVYDGSPYPNAFQWIELLPTSAGAPKTARLHCRLWNKGEWQVDRNQPGCETGVAELSLPVD